MGDNSPLYSLGGDFMPKAKRFENLEFLFKMRLEHIERLKNPVIVIQEGVYEKDDDGGTRFGKTVSDYRTKFRNKDEVIQYGRRLNESILKEIDSDSQLRGIKADLMSKGKTEEEVINFIGKNFYDIANMRKNKYRTGEFVPLGRPKNENKEPRKADRYKTTREISAQGNISIDYIKKLTGKEIKGLDLKEAQRIAYYLQRYVKGRITRLTKEGRGSIDPVNKFFESGSYVNVTTASLNSLKSFISRGRKFVSSKRLDKNYEEKIKNRVYKGIKKKTGLDLKDKLADVNIDKLFWKAVHFAERSGYASAFSKGKYEILNTIDSYFAGNSIKDDLNLEDNLNAYMMNVLDEMGIEVYDVDDMRNFLSDIYLADIEDYE